MVAVKEICRLGFSGAHLCEQEQYSPGTCSDRHLNMQRISLITLTHLRLEGESDGARSRRGKSKIAPVKGSQCLVPKHPGSCSLTTSVTTDILQGTEPPAASQMRLRLPLASFPAEPQEVWELPPLRIAEGSPANRRDRGFLTLPPWLPSILRLACSHIRENQISSG